MDICRYGQKIDIGSSHSIVSRVKMLLVVKTERGFIIILYSFSSSLVLVNIFSSGQ